MINEYQYRFEDLRIAPEDLYELLGFENGEVPEPFPAYTKQALREAPGLCDIRGGYKIFNSTIINNDNKTIELEGQRFSPSKTVTTQLRSSTQAALFVCTAGSLISEYSSRISAEQDPVLGYVFDVLGSLVVEKATDKIQDALKIHVQQNGLNISDRYSPGYCEWSVSEQQKLFSLLPENFCGIKLSASSLMHPIKSVSGIIGIGARLQQKGYQCEWCTDKNCIYGTIKRKK